MPVQLKHTICFKYVTAGCQPRAGEGRRGCQVGCAPRHRLPSRADLRHSLVSFCFCLCWHRYCTDLQCSHDTHSCKRPFYLGIRRSEGVTRTINTLTTQKHTLFSHSQAPAVCRHGSSSRTAVRQQRQRTRDRKAERGCFDRTGSHTTSGFADLWEAVPRIGAVTGHLLRALACVYVRDVWMRGECVCISIGVQRACTWV